MLSRYICFILIGALLLQMGCARPVVITQPEPSQDLDLSLPLEVKVTLKREVLLQGPYSEANAITWRTDRISGELIAWNDEVMSIRRTVRGRLGGFKARWVSKVPIEDIEKIQEISKGAKVAKRGCCVLGGMVAAVGVLLLMWFLLIPEDIFGT